MYKFAGIFVVHGELVQAYHLHVQLALGRNLAERPPQVQKEARSGERGCGWNGSLIALVLSDCMVRDITTLALCNFRCPYFPSTLAQIIIKNPILVGTFMRKQRDYWRNVWKHFSRCRRTNRRGEFLWRWAFCNRFVSSPTVSPIRWECVWILCTSLRICEQDHRLVELS